MDEMDAVREQEEAYYQAARARLGDSISLTQDLVELYEWLATTSLDSGFAMEDPVAAPLNFLMACRYQLTIGALAALRGHTIDSLHSTRMAIEQAAFAAKVQRHPHLAMIWLHAGRSSEDYDVYRDKFSGGKIFRGDQAVLSELGERYDFFSKSGHPSIYAMAGLTTIGSSPQDEAELTLSYFQRQDPTEPISTFFLTLDTHMKIVRLFEEILARPIAKQKVNWEVRRNGVEAKLHVHKTKWKGTILGGTPSP